MSDVWHDICHMSDVSLALRVNLSRVTILFKATQCLLMVPSLPSLHPHKLPFSFFKHIMFPLPIGPFHILIYQTDSLLCAISNKSRVFSETDEKWGIILVPHSTLQRWLQYNYNKISKSKKQVLNWNTFYTLE